MKVTLINKEQVKEFYKEWGEFAAVCYNSPKDRADKIGRHCFKNAHFSGSRTTYFKFEISEVSRALSMQLNRHEIGVVKNQQSQRYVDMKDMGIIIPPSIANNKEALAIFISSIEDSKKAYIEIQKLLLKDTCKQEKANEDARYILSSATMTAGTYGFTYEALEHFMHKRLCSRAQWEIRELAKLMKEAVVEVLPELKDSLNPHCEYLMWCPEGASCCGRKPTKEVLKSKLDT